jgi:diacylglycerol kinase family enzyme
LTTMRATLIVNPFASRVTEERLRAVERVLADKAELTTLLTQRRGHAVELAEEAEGETLYVYGGDGVYNEAVNGLTRDVPVGFVPGGHTNVFPRALGLPQDAVAAARRLREGRTRRITLGRVNGRRFTFSAGIGIDADAVRRIDELGRAQDGRRPGDLAYSRVVASLLVRGYEAGLEVRGVGRAGFILVSNDAVYTYAGRAPARFSPSARFELGLDFVAPERPKGLALPRLLGRIAVGRGLEGARGVLSGHDVDRLEVDCDRPMPLQADGEDLGDVTEAVFEAERDAIAVLV